MSINVFLSEKLPKKKDNIISIISFDNEVNYCDNILSTGIPSLGSKKIYEIWEVDAKVDHKQYESLNISLSQNHIFGFTIIDNNVSYEELQLTIKKNYANFYKAANQNNMDIVKIWHYMPELLKVYSSKKTNYSLLCDARESVYKDYFKDLSYPAATVIGIEGNKILMYFLGASCLKYNVIENKRQVSYYDYPQNIFLEKPMFSRAVRFLAHRSDNEKIVISGTASIKGYKSMHNENLKKQLNEAVKNYKTFVDIKNNNTNICRVYLSKSQIHHAQIVIKELDKIFKSNNYLLLQGDICREELLVELEGISSV